MSASSRSPHVDIDRDRVLDDELDAAPVEEATPEHLDLPIETPEADALEQHEDVPVADDDYR